MKKVYLNDHICQSAVERLRKHVELVDNFDHPEELDAIIVRQQYCTREIIAKAKKCKLIQMHGTGLDRVDVEAAKEYGIPVLTTAGGNAESVAELAVAMILSLSRKLPYINQGVKKGAFQSFGLPETEGSEVRDKVLGLVGGGRIAQITANIMKAAFNSKILVYDPFLPALKAVELGFEKIDTLEELTRRSDFISIHVPLTDSTWHMFHEGSFDHANPDLILVNTARGGVVDEKALYEALVSGKIKAAGMDVFEEQPPKVDNPLLSLENFIGTIHIGGSTKEALERNGKGVVDNVFQALGVVEEWNCAS